MKASWKWLLFLLIPSFSFSLISLSFSFSSYFSSFSSYFSSSFSISLSLTNPSPFSPYRGTCLVAV